MIIWEPEYGSVGFIIAVERVEQLSDLLELYGWLIPCQQRKYRDQIQDQMQSIIVLLTLVSAKR